MRQLFFDNEERNFKMRRGIKDGGADMIIKRPDSRS
jgi:hypothetical protein